MNPALELIITEKEPLYTILTKWLNEARKTGLSRTIHLYPNSFKKPQHWVALIRQGNGPARKCELPNIDSNKARSMEYYIGKIERMISAYPVSASCSI